MVTLKDVMAVIERWAPPRLAENGDNSGLQLGDPATLVKRILVTLDVNQEVVKEAAAHKAELIVSHHPLFWQPLKSIDYHTPIGKLVNLLVQNQVMVYCAHTNLDSTEGGVNSCLAAALGLKVTGILKTGFQERLLKLVVFVPQAQLEAVREAICQAGAGIIGNYSHCTFQVSGEGSFRPLAGTHPYTGEVGKLNKVAEARLEVCVPENKLREVMTAMLAAHPYEEVAYDLYALNNNGPGFGLGRLGLLPHPLSLGELVLQVREALEVPFLKVVGQEERLVQKVAVCGGAGAGFIRRAAGRVDVFITGDVGYHQAQEAQALGLALIDAGHYGTERVIVPVLARYLQAELPEVEINLSQVKTDPWHYSGI
jgi:dinuclear metal center YbgI/SA1388 family protein